VWPLQIHDEAVIFFVFVVLRGEGALPRCGVSSCSDGSAPRDVSCDPLVTSSPTMTNANSIKTVGVDAARQCCSSLNNCFTAVGDQTCWDQFKNCLTCSKCGGLNPDDCFAAGEAVYQAAMVLGCAGWDTARCPIPPPPPPPTPPPIKQNAMKITVIHKKRKVQVAAFSSASHLCISYLFLPALMGTVITVINLFL